MAVVTFGGAYAVLAYVAQQAVERFGILEGLALSWRRLRSCQRSVPLGTLDPVAD